MDVDAVEEGAADAFLVAGNGGGGAAAFFDGVAVEAARASVRGAVATDAFMLSISIFSGLDR